MMEVLNDAERSAMGAADAVKQLLDALRGHLKEVTSNTVAHVEMERDTATRLQGAAMEAANRGMRFINACMRCAWGEHGVNVHEHGVNVHEVRPTPGTPYPSGAGQHVGNPEGYTATDIVARGAGLHVGHPEGYTATDIVARYKRMRGFNVLHPMGWDAFGLPAEQYAIELKALGFSYDWQREVSTTDPDYYRWTQWIFLQILNRGLAYQPPYFSLPLPLTPAPLLRILKSHVGVPATLLLSAPPSHSCPSFENSQESRWRPSHPTSLCPSLSLLPFFENSQKSRWRPSHPTSLCPSLSLLPLFPPSHQADVAVNWCPALGTVLANEEVVDGLSERGGHPVIRKHPLFLNMLRAVNAAGPGYVPPKRGYVGGAGLLACKQQIEKGLTPITKTWKETGMTIASDMMRDKSGRAQMNILCINANEAIFQEAVDCKAETKSGAFIVSVLQPVIEKVGPEHVVAICTDGGSNYVSTAKLLQKKYPHIEFVPCATHVLDLLLEDFGSMAWAQEVVPVATDMISFIRSHTWTRAFLRCPELHGEEKSLQPLQPAGTRFGTQYIAVSRLREIRPQLTAMVTHKDWEEKGRKQLTGKDFEASVLDVEWWAKVDTFMKVMALPYKVMRKTDGPAKGMMGAMYDLMLQLTEDLSALLESADCPLSDADKEGLLEHLRRRWDESLACPLHVVGRILNPVNQEEGIYLKDIECTRVMKAWLSRSRAFVDNVFACPGPKRQWMLRITEYADCFPLSTFPMRQWMLRITEYADRLLDDLDGLDWPESVKEMQRNWIGRSEGAEVEFAIADVADGSASVRVFTTRPDTICGATYLVLAPEHPLVTSITSEQQRAAVEAYVVAAGQKSDLERTDLAKGKTGVPTGAEAVNPVTGERIPVWVADYVLARRTGLAKSKTGHAMGPEAVNPVTGERIPVWVADYVLASYGTGAIICQRPRMMHVTSHALLLRRLKRHMMHVTSHALTHPSSPLSRCLSYCDLASPCYTAATARGASWQCRDTTRETSNHFPFALPPSPSLPAATARGPSWQCRDSTRETSNHFPFALPPSPSLPAATARGASWQCGDTTPEARLKAPSFTLLFALPHPSHPICCSYGTGAIMAVPAHDSRDLEFAQTFSLPVRQVVRQAAQRSGGGKGKKASGEAAREEEEAAIEEAYAGSGVMVNSGYESTGVDLNGLDNTAAGDAVVAWLEERGLGKKQVRQGWGRSSATGGSRSSLKVPPPPQLPPPSPSQINYKLRDWLFARQRYWGEPFPVVLVPGEDGQERVVGVPESQLPVVLPEMDDFNPTGTGEPPLAKATDWVNTTDPASGLPARRETNTMPQWAGSCWYYLRFMDPANSNALVDPQKEKYWGPVDLYVGGAEHSVLHLLYARFWHKVLYDIGAVSTKEPFQCLVNQGMILGEVEFTAYRDTASGALLSADAAAKRPAGECVPERVPEEAVEKKGEGYVLRADPSVGVSARAHKMSKSRGNVVNPDHVVFEFGADSLRLYEMFMGPLRETKVWSTKGVEGVHRFLARVWRLLVGQADPATGQYRSHGVAPSVVDDAPSEEQLRALHACIHKVTEEVEAMRFNTAIAAMMEFTNAAYKWPSVPKDAARPLVLLLSPFAPHVAEELWQRLGGTSSLAYEPWPQALPQYLVEDTIALPVQVNGKVRATLQVAVGVEQEAAVAAALDHPNVARLVEGKSVRKTIFVKGRILNLVVG
ncbi:unnamed protein product [Closterium sp. NIES-64]|nr:unnamed protein product [Closterium sp. NIES-64]